MTISFGQLGIDTQTGPELCAPWGAPCSTIPVRVHTKGLRFLHVSAGDTYTCGVTAGLGSHLRRHRKSYRPYCWGTGEEGRLGDGAWSRHLTPFPVSTDRAFRDVWADGGHSCGVTTSDQAFCWGRSGVGQLGDGNATQERLTPIRVLGGLLFSNLSAGPRYTCGTTTDYRAYCWGENTATNLGNGSDSGPELCAMAGIPCSTRPPAVLGGLQFRQVDGGGWFNSDLRHTCGVTTGNRAYCWGSNGDGQLGDGTTTTRLTPTPVAGPEVARARRPQGDASLSSP